MNEGRLLNHLVACNIEIGSTSAAARVSFEIAVIRCPLINTPLQRGDWGARVLRTVSTVSLTSTKGATVKTVAIDLSFTNTQLKLGVNEKLVSNSLLQVT